MTKDSFLFSSVLVFSLHFFQCQNLNLTSNRIHKILSLVQQIHSVVVIATLIHFSDLLKGVCYLSILGLSWL